MSATPILPMRFLGRALWGDVRFLSTEVQIGTGGTAIADSATTSVLIPKPASTQCQLIRLDFTALVAALSAGGTVLGQVFKRDNSGTPADRTLTGTKSFEADIITVLDQTYPWAITATSIQNLTFLATDACRMDVVTTSSVGTAPVITVCALWAIQHP